MASPRPLPPPRRDRRRALSASLVLALALLAPACSESLRIELPREGDAVVAFPGEGFGPVTEQATEAKPQALALTSVEPSGTIQEVQSITLSFNQPMVEVDGVKELGAASPVSISPPLEGAWRWIGPRTLTFSPSGPMPLATTFRVKVPGSLKSLSGQTLGADAEHTFQTPGLHVARYAPSWYNARLAPSDAIFLHFNLPVEQAQLAGRLRLVKRYGGSDIPVEVELTATQKDAGGDDVKGGSAFFIKPRGGAFEQGVTYRLDLDKTLVSSAGPLGLDKPWSHEFKTYGPFEVKGVTCWGTCPPEATWTVEFSNPIEPKDVARCVTISPKVELRDAYGYDTRLQLRPVNPTPGTRYTVAVSPRCKDRLGNAMVRPFTQSVQVGHYSPLIQMQRGMAFMEAPSAPGEPLKLPVTLRNIQGAQVKMLRVEEADLARFAVDFDRWDSKILNNFKPMVDRAYGADLKPDASRTYGVDLREVLGSGGHGVAYVALEGKNLHDSQRRFSQAAVQVTDIGLTAKYSPESILVWTTRLSTTEPMAGVRVAMQAPDGKVLWEGTTGDDGIARGPGLSTFGAVKPRVLLAKKGDDLTFIDLESWDMQLAPWRFGYEYAWDAAPAEVRGFVFAERGVFRPGERVHLKGYLRADRGRSLELLPQRDATVTVTDSRDSVILTRQVQLSALGSLDLEVDLPARAPLGTYSVSVRPAAGDANLQGEATGSFRVEAYRAPDFEVVVEPEAQHVSPGDTFAGQIQGRYLFGAAMSGARVEWRLSSHEVDFRPAGYDGFDFGSWEGRYWWSDYERETRWIGSGEGHLDATGALGVEQALPTGDDAPRQAHVVTLEADVTDLNNQVISGRGEVRLHPADVYVGLKRPGYLVKTGEPFQVEVVAVRPDGTPAAGQRVDVVLKRREWRSVRKKSAGGGMTWVTESVDEEKGRCKVTAAATPQPCALSIASPGYYILEGSAQDSQQRQALTNSSVYAWGGGDYWWGQQDDERVQLVADKASYNLGDTARVMIQSPFTEARALITVERRGVIQQWTRTVRGATDTVEIPITEDMLPNAYASVVLLRGRVEAPRDADPSVVDPGKPSYRVGYVELNVNKDAQRLQVSVEPAQPTYRPGEEVVATLHLKDGQGRPVAGEVAFMAVDEGVLSLTGYKTPNPVDALYKHQPLAVITSENRMGIVARTETEEEGEKGDEGGDGSGGEATNYRSAFATTAAFMPRVEIGADGAAQVRFKLPDNLTAFRLMAVGAAEGNRFGSAEARVQVRKSLMVRPALPRFLSAGDVMDLRAVVQNVSEQPIEVAVKVQVEGPVQLTGVDTLQVHLAPGASQRVTFPARVLNPGEAVVKLKALGAGEEDAVALTLPVRFPATTRQWSESGVVRAGEDASRVFRRIAVPDGVRPDVGGLDIELTSTAMGELLPGLGYLIHYPYGCAEQTTGRTLPLVALTELIDTAGLPGLPTGDVKTFAQAGVERLWTMQTWEGGLGYWPGDDAPNPWGSAYGGLALVRASQTEGLQVNPERLNNLLEYLVRVVHGEAEEPHYWYQDAWDVVRPLAAYVLALAGRLEPAQISELFEQRAVFPHFGRALLALAFVEAGASPDLSRKLLDEALIGVQDNGATARVEGGFEEWSWMLMDSNVRANAILLLAMLRVRPDDPLTDRFARGLLEDRQGGRWGNTQENAFAVMALGAWFARTERDEPLFKALVGLGDEAIGKEGFAGRSLTPRTLHIPMKDLLAHKGDVLSLVREGERGALYYTMTLRYAEAQPKATPFDNGFTLMREYIAADGPNKGKPVQRVQVGDLVKVRLTLVAPSARRYVAVEDPLPAGLEIVNTSFETAGRQLGAEVDQENKDQEDDGWWYPSYSFDHIEQRDDRVLLFADVLDSGVFNHTYMARATTPGTFAAPAARAEEMYAPRVYGRSQATSLTIE